MHLDETTAFRPFPSLFFVTSYKKQRVEGFELEGFEYFPFDCFFS